uniref:2-dehydropantoate 2-reductase n=1 Tax=Picocystis salinarum TaxID=88271 RepID=A0A7S3UH39_9CHLO
MEPCIVVVGGGRVGTYLACKMRQARARVLLKGSGRKKGKASYALQGYVDTLCEDAGVEQISSFETLRNQEVDFVFIATKTYDISGVQEELKENCVRPKVVVLIHNGIIKDPFDCPTVRVVVPQGYDFVETPGKGCGVKILVKNEDKPWIMPNTEAARKVEALLSKCNMPSCAHPHFSYLMIRKFFINGVANLLSIVADTNCNGLLQNHRKTMDNLYDEIYKVLQKPHADAFKLMPDNFYSIVFEGLASYSEHHPSSWHDFKAGSQIEIESLNGYVKQLANDQGMQVPETDALLCKLQEMLKQRGRELESTC